MIDSYVTVSTWTNAGLSVAQQAPAAVLAAFQGLTTEEEAKLVVWLSMFNIVVNVLLGQDLSGQSTKTIVLPVGKLNVPSSGFATPEANKGCTGNEPLTIDSVGGSISLFGSVALTLLIAASMQRI